jgi:hypothetical protein
VNLAHRRDRAGGAGGDELLPDDVVELPRERVETRRQVCGREPRMSDGVNLRTEIRDRGLTCGSEMDGTARLDDVLVRVRVARAAGAAP